jgi:hypothetical protein
MTIKAVINAIKNIREANIDHSSTEKLRSKRNLKADPLPTQILKLWLKNMRWWHRATNIKYPELLLFYKNYEGEKCKYSVFRSRAIRYGYSKEEAIQKVSYLWKHMIKGEIKEKGRNCTNCWIFKPRSEFSKDLSNKYRHTPDCKECRKRKKRAYREQNQRSKDKEYRLKKRKLQIGEYIAFLNPVLVEGIPREDVREVVGYTFKKGYSIKSVHTWLERTLDTGDNQKVNKNCERFYRVDKPIELVPETEILPNLY